MKKKQPIRADGLITVMFDHVRLSDPPRPKHRRERWSRDVHRISGSDQLSQFCRPRSAYYLERQRRIVELTGGRLCRYRHFESAMPLRSLQLRKPARE
jgi:hypothetical protein